MTHPLQDALAAALKQVVTSHLQRSGLGQVWRDDRTWSEFAREVVVALSARVVLIDRAEYQRLKAEADQMKLVRGYVEQYHSMLPKSQQKNSTRNAYARWAAENMPEKSK